MKPSETYDVYWIFGERKVGKYPSHTSRGGKWLVFCPVEIIDKTWETIRGALICGKLGSTAKVSTRRPNPNSTDPNTGVICVYTYDSDDNEDVMEIRETLRDLGFVRRLLYKTDQATRERKYGPRVFKYSN